MGVFIDGESKMGEVIVDGRAVDAPFILCGTSHHIVGQ